MSGVDKARHEVRALIDRLVTSSAVSVDKLPVLNQIFEQAGQACLDAFREAGAREADLSVDYIQSGRGADLLGIHESSITAVVHAALWDARILVGIDRPFLFSMLETLFGADGSEPPVVEARPLSTAEGEVAKWTLATVVTALRTAFSDVADTTMALESMEVALDMGTLGGPSAQVVVAKFNLRAPGGIGRLFIALPQAAIMPFRVKLEKLPKREAPIVDPGWSERFRNQIQRAGVEVRAVLGSRDMTLGEITRLKPGQVIELDRASKNRVRVESNGLPLFWSELGQADGLYTLRVNEFVDHEQEFMDDILPL